MTLDRKHRTGGLGDNLPELFDLCPSDSAKEVFLKGIAALCLKSPFIEQFHRVAARYQEFARSMVPLARRALEHFRKPTDGVLAALVVVERAGSQLGGSEMKPLRELVASFPQVNRALLWTDVYEERKIKGETPSIRIWQVSIHGQLWSLSSADIDWLKGELQTRTNILDRQIALSAIATLYREELKAREPELRGLIKGAKVLNDDLSGYLAPQPVSPTQVRWQQREKALGIAQAMQAEKDKQSWREFHADIVAHAAELRDPVKLADWKGGGSHLLNLTIWLERRIGNENANAAREWRLLADAFGQEVAFAFRDGMRTYWRITEPKRLVAKPGAPFSYNQIYLLSVAGVGIEAAEDPDWIAKLSDEEVLRAFRHGVYDPFGYPTWQDELLALRPALLVAEVRALVEAEWANAEQNHNPFLYRFSSRQSAIEPPLQDLLFDVISGPEPILLNVFSYGVRILKKLDLDEDKRRTLMTWARARLAGCTDDDRRPFAIRYLAVMMLADVDVAVDDFAQWLADREYEKPGYGEWAFGVLFERHDPLVYGVLDGASPVTLELLLNLAYRMYVPRMISITKALTPLVPEMPPKRGRNTVLSALLDRPGPDAYQAFHRLSNSPALKLRRHRFLELAKSKAERDSEFLPWTEAEVLKFRDRYAAPVKTGHDLLEVLSAVMRDIQHGFGQSDVTSASLLRKAENEEEVKLWLVEQLNLRSRERFVAAREAEISYGDKPDIIASSTSAPVSVAFEVKHGGHELVYERPCARGYESARGGLSKARGPPAGNLCALPSWRPHMEGPGRPARPSISISSSLISGGWLMPSSRMLMVRLSFAFLV